MRDEWVSPGRLTSAGLVRAGVGAAMVAQPSRVLTSMGVDTVTARRVSWVASMVGIRDVALGAGLVHAVRRGHDPRPWLVAQAASDAVDAAALSGAVARKDVRPTKAVAVVAVAAASAVSTALAWRELDLRSRLGSS